jgi:HK97 family phage major capsid protein
MKHDQRQALAYWLRSHERRDRLGREARDAYERHAEATGCHSDSWRAGFPLLLRDRPPGVEQRTLSPAVPDSGAYLIGESSADDVEIALRVNNPVRRSGALVLRTPTSADLQYPVITSEVDVEGEISAPGAARTTADLTVGALNLKAWVHDSKWLVVPAELVEDAIPAALPRLLGLLADRVARLQARHMTTGSGSSQCSGFLVAGTSGRTASNAGSLTYTDLVELLKSVDPAYRESATAAWMMHSDTLMAVREIVDGSTRPVLMDGEGGQPMLLGYKVIPNRYVQAIGTGNKSVAFGSWQEYAIRDVREARIIRTDETYREKDAVGLLLSLRTDAAPLLSEAIKYIVHP